MEIIKGLIYGSDDVIGYGRKRIGRGFIYLDENKNKIEDEAIIKRIKDLKIPPMWKDVWVSNKINTHLQATGKDQKGRKQYLYHAKWSQFRNESKFKRMEEFGKALPMIRKTSLQDMNLPGWSKDKILGLIVQLLNEAFIRIGNTYYKEQNETYGLTTLRRKHLKIQGKAVSFQYKAKSGKYRKISIKNSRLSKLIAQCSALPGHEIFRFQDDENGKWHNIDSHDVNEYLRKISGQQFSSKDFRTWGGSVSAIDKLEEAQAEVRNSKKKSLTPTLVKMVAEKLGNTVAICREYYIHPAVLEAAESNNVLAFGKGLNRKFPKLKNDLSHNELVVLNIIKTYEAGLVSC